METSYSIHNIINIRLINPTSHVVAFVDDELDHFCQAASQEADVEIEFVNKIDVPDPVVYILRDMAYCEGRLYLEWKEGVVCFPVRDFVANQAVRVKAEKTISGWTTLLIIEKVLSFKAIEKGYCMMHSLCLLEDNGIVLYGGMQGAGKTKLALKKLSAGSQFLGEEYVFMNSAGVAFCYPRGINVHRYQEEEYFRLRYNPYLAKEIKRDIRKQTCLNTIRCLVYPVRSVRERVEMRISGKRFIRANVRKLFPDLKIVESGQINKIVVFMKGRNGPLMIEDWPTERLAEFLAVNNHIERMNFVAEYINSFLAYGDKYGILFKSYMLNTLGQERDIIKSSMMKIQ